MKERVTNLLGKASDKYPKIGCLDYVLLGANDPTASDFVGLLAQVSRTAVVAKGFDGHGRRLVARTESAVSVLRTRWFVEYQPGASRQLIARS